MRWLVLAAGMMVLSGCGLPPIVTYTSYMADIFSYLTTSKSFARLLGFTPRSRAND